MKWQWKYKYIHIYIYKYISMFPQTCSAHNKVSFSNLFFSYLLEDQLKGPSSVDGYIRALQKGCRCVECKYNIWCCAWKWFRSTFMQQTETSKMFSCRKKFRGIIVIIQLLLLIQFHWWIFLRYQIVTARPSLTDINSRFCLVYVPSSL